MIQTADPAARDALYEFLRFQIREHKTGDPAGAALTPMTDPATMRSGVLARLAGVSTDTLRFYERRGLLPRPPRDASGYRRYPSSALTRVRVIQQALDAGFTIVDLARVFGQRDAGGAPCREVSGLRPHASRSSTSGSPDCRRCARNSGESFVTGRSGSPRRPPDVERACSMALRLNRPRPGSVPGAVGVVPWVEDVSLLYRARAGAVTFNVPASARGSPSCGAGSRPRSDISSG